MKTKLLICAFILARVACQAQSDSATHYRNCSNSIFISSADYSIPHIIHEDNPVPLLPNEHFIPYPYEWQSQVGIYYERKIYKNFRISLGYGEWNDLKYWTNVHTNGNMLIRADTGFPQVGHVEFRYLCEMYDVFFNYRLEYFKRHKISVGIGISYLKESEIYVDSIYFNPWGYDYIIYSHQGEGHYWGVVPVLSYDYLLLWRRVGIGGDIRYRKYFGLFSAQIDYGFHLKFNF